MGVRLLFGRLFYVILIVSLTIGWLADVSLAQPQSIELEATYARLESARPGDGFQFIVTLRYQGYEARNFNLLTSGPDGWTTYVTPVYTSTRISAIELEPDEEDSGQVKVTAFPPKDKTLQPGEYKIILSCSGGALGDSIELTAVVLPAYSTSLQLFREQYYNEIKSGQDNVLSMSIRNTGNEAISNISFSSVKPTGWFVSFEPDEIDYLGVDDSQEFDFIIRPDDRSAAGNYDVTLIVESDQMRSEREIRVTVEKVQTVWLWVGVAVICVAVAGFVIVYMRFGRRPTG